METDRRTYFTEFVTFLSNAVVTMAFCGEPLSLPIEKLIA